MSLGANGLVYILHLRRKKNSLTLNTGRSTENMAYNKDRYNIKFQNTLKIWKIKNPEKLNHLSDETRSKKVYVIHNPYIIEEYTITVPTKERNLMFFWPCIIIQTLYQLPT